MAVSILRRVLFVAAALSGLAWEALASAAPMSIRVPLTGAEQVPPVQTSGKGTAQLTYDPDTESRDLDGRVQRALGPGHDGPFSRAGDGWQERPADDLANEKGFDG